MLTIVSIEARQVLVHFHLLRISHFECVCLCLHNIHRVRCLGLSSLMYYTFWFGDVADCDVASCVHDSTVVRSVRSNCYGKHIFGGPKHYYAIDERDIIRNGQCHAQRL